MKPRNAKPFFGMDEEKGYTTASHSTLRFLLLYVFYTSSNGLFPNPSNRGSSIPPFFPSYTLIPFAASGCNKQRKEMTTASSSIPSPSFPLRLSSSTSLPLWPCRSLPWLFQNRTTLGGECPFQFLTLIILLRLDIARLLCMVCIDVFVLHAGTEGVVRHFEVLLIPGMHRIQNIVEQVGAAMRLCPVGIRVLLRVHFLSTKSLRRKREK